MAKKKTNKKASFLTKYGKFILLALAAVLFICLALPGVKYTPKEGEAVTYNLAQLIFGAKLLPEDASSILDYFHIDADVAIDFSIGGLIALMIPLLITIISLFVKNKKLSGAMVFLGFAVSAILFFLMPQLTSLTVTSPVTIPTLGKVFTNSFYDLEYGLGAGSILGGTISIVGALGSLCYTVSK